MRIEINPSSLLNLEHICEVLYKLHPSVLDGLVEIERSLGDVLDFIDLNNTSLKEREFLANIFQEKDYSSESFTFEDLKEKMEANQTFDNKEDSTSRLLKTIEELKKDKKSIEFLNLIKYLQLDTDEFIPMKIYVEVEDPVIGKKVKELVEALQKTRSPQQFYFYKQEVDQDAYFAEGYGLTMNEEQKKKRDDFFWGEDVEGLEKLLIKEKLYP